MTTYIEIHAIQTVPPSCINRGDDGTPKTATYGGVLRSRVSSQSWKHAIRKDFNKRLDPSSVGTRSTLMVEEIAKSITKERPDLKERSIELGVSAMEAAGFKKPASKKRGKNQELGTPETEYLVFLSQHQINALAKAAITASDSTDPLKDMKAAKVKNLLDTDHSIDIALFGRMIADSADLNVDAACQVAHAISVHAAEPEFDFYTAVDDARDRDEDESDAGAGMMGTVGFVSSTLYRYAALNVDQLLTNLGSPEVTRKATQEFLRSFCEAMPTGKINTFANGTRPAAILVTITQGQPASLVGAFDKPVFSQSGYTTPAIERLAQHAKETFELWNAPRLTLVSGLPSEIEGLMDLGEFMNPEALFERVATEATADL